MEAEPLAAVSALWLGILTSISPCPLATNIAAVSFVGQQVGRARWVLAAGGLYTAGRMLAYTTLGGAAVWSLMSVVDVSGFLQGTFYRLLGPILIVVGLILLGLFTLKLPAIGVGERLKPTHLDLPLGQPVAPARRSVAVGRDASGVLVTL